MSESAVAAYANDLPGWLRKLGANRQWQPPAQSRQAPRREKPLTGRSAGQVIGDPDRRVACVGDNNRFGRHHSIDVRHETLRANGALVLSRDAANRVSPIANRIGDGL